jgi:hypothetical protein
MKVTSDGGYEIGVNNTNSLDIWNFIFLIINNIRYV